MDKDKSIVISEIVSMLLEEKAFKSRNFENYFLLIPEGISVSSTLENDRNT